MSNTQETPIANHRGKRGRAYPGGVTVADMLDDEVLAALEEGDDAGE